MRTAHTKILEGKTVLSGAKTPLTLALGSAYSELR